MRLIYFAPVPYSSYGQRPQYLTRELARQLGDADVIWVDPYPTRWPKLHDLYRPKESQAIGLSDWPRLEVLRVPRFPIEPLPGSERINAFFAWRAVMRRLVQASGGDTILGIGRPSKLALWALGHLTVRRRFFDAMDDFPAFYSGWSRCSYSRTEHQIANQVELITCTSTALLAKWNKHGVRAELALVPNAYVMGSLPQWLESRVVRRRVGFVGAMADWFDWSLLMEMANSLPTVEFALVGPAFTPIPKLPHNVVHRPACSVEEAIDFLRTCDCGVIPFQKTELTDAVDPIKYYEMRALGLPIWTTDFGEMTGRQDKQGVWEIRPGIDWLALWEDTVGWQPAPEQIAEFRELNDWSVRAEQLMTLLSDRGRKHICAR